ncbi:hypothetical protein D3C87_1346800 [compost metagenome]
MNVQKVVQIYSIWIHDLRRIYVTVQIVNDSAVQPGDQDMIIANLISDTHAEESVRLRERDKRCIRIKTRGLFVIEQDRLFDPTGKRKAIVASFLVDLHSAVDHKDFNVIA